MNVKEASCNFLSHCKSVKKLSLNTVRAYTKDLEDFKILVSKNRNQPCEIGELTKEDIRQFIVHLFENRKLKEASVKRKVACLKVFFRWLEMEDQIDTSPFHKLDTKISLPRQLPRNIPSYDLKLLFSKFPTISADSDQFDGLKMKQNKSQLPKIISQLTARLSVEILFETGVRVSELVSITPEDINEGDKSINIFGKGKQERKVFIVNQEIMNLIRIYRRLRDQLSSHSETLLINSRGKAASAQYIRKLVRNAGEEAGISFRITPHMFRHSCATQLLEAGVDIRFVQKLLGHASISTTEKYTQVCDSALRDTIERAATKRRL